MSITTVISYCTNDYRFFGKCVEEAWHFSDRIIVPVCDHFFNGMPENRDLLHWTYAQHPRVEFIEFPYSEKLYPSYIRYTPEDPEWARHWHALVRVIGFYHAKSEWILFLDSDEIMEGKRFLQEDFSAFNAVRLTSYYYVLKPYIRARWVQNIALLARRKFLEPKHFYQPNDRSGIYECIPNRQWGYLGVDGRPLTHHYSWVRPELECVKKVTTWGHRLDKDWKPMVQDLFREKLHAIHGTEIEFEEISDVYFDPLAVPLPSAPPPQRTGRPFANLTKLTRGDFLRLELNHDQLL